MSWKLHNEGQRFLWSSLRLSRGKSESFWLRFVRAYPCVTNLSHPKERPPLDSIEILLCLIYRHLDFYLNSGPNARYSTTTERAMRMISTAKSNASGVRAGEAEEEMLMLRERAAGEVLPLLESLEATALVSYVHPYREFGSTI
jgi:hypothetical protein